MEYADLKAKVKQRRAEKIERRAATKERVMSHRNSSPEREPRDSFADRRAARDEARQAKHAAIAQRRSE